jgi:prophage antirepressor-like protein
MPNNPTIEQAGQGIQMFTNPSFGSVRTAGTPNNPQFCLIDLCKALDLSPNVVKQRLSDEVCSTYPIPDRRNRIQPTNFVNEDGLYDVILDSRKPEAKQFRKWITSDVLPTIRKTGGYIHQEEGDTDADIMAKALMIAQKTIDDKKQRIQMLEGENSYLQKENALMAPKAQYTDEVLQSTATLTFTEVAKELNFRSAVSLIQRLVKDHIIYKQSNRYLPYARYSGVGYFASRTHRFFHSDGRPGVEVSTVVTQKGRHFLHEYFKVQMEPMSVELFNE